MNKNLTILGAGNMGAAIAGQLADSGYHITIFDIQEQKAHEAASQSENIVIAENIKTALEKNSPILFAVKPAYISELASNIQDERLIISIAAGITLDAIDAARTHSGPTVRAMPNTPLQVSEGVTALVTNSRATEESLVFTTSLFECCGEVVVLDNENQMHAVTALSGSGPAYVMSFMQALEDGAVLNGLPRELARKLARQTIAGSIALERNHPGSANDIIQQVTSPGGTTIAGLKALKQHGFDNAVQEAITMATKRSKELSTGKD